MLVLRSRASEEQPWQYYRPTGFAEGFDYSVQMFTSHYYVEKVLELFPKYKFSVIHIIQAESERRPIIQT